MNLCLATFVATGEFCFSNDWKSLYPFSTGEAFVIPPARESSVADSSNGSNRISTQMSPLRTQDLFKSGSSPKPSNWVREVSSQDGAAPLDIRQGICLSLNPVAALIWNQSGKPANRHRHALRHDLSILGERGCASAEQCCCNTGV